MTFKEFLLQERFINLFQSDKDERLKYVDEVWDLLQQSYAPIGGIHGSGFGSKEEMVAKLPFWKLIRKNDKIVTVVVYKDKSGRKMVAGGTDGSKDGKKGLLEILTADLKQQRAFGELSGPLLNFLVKNVGETTIKDYLIDPKIVEKLTGDGIFSVPDDDVHLKKFPLLKDFFYQREIGGSLHTKIALGVPQKKIVDLG